MIKICGMRDADNIREVEQLLASNSSTPLMGFIFWPKSSRYVSERPAYLPTQCKRVGVFVDEDIETVLHKVEEFGLDFIQLHGHESPDYIRGLRFQVPGSRFQVIKAFNIATKEDLEQTAPYEGLVDYFLFDTKGKCVGGNGEKFDWSVLSSYHGATPFLLSGGIGPEDAETLNSQLSTLNSHCVGIDLNSRFEISPAVKDINKLKTFLQSL